MTRPLPGDRLEPARPDADRLAPGARVVPDVSVCTVCGCVVANTHLDEHDVWHAEQARP